MKADLNLFDSYRMNNKHVVTKSSALYTIIALIIMVVVLIAVTTGVLVAFNITDAQKINQLKIENMELKRDTAKVESIQAELKKINETIKVFEAIDNDIKIARMLSKQDIDKIYASLVNTTVKSNTYSNGVMVIACTTNDIHNPAKSAQALDKEGISAEVNYAGFSAKDAKTGEDQASTASVEYTITCYIAQEEEAVPNE